MRTGWSEPVGASRPALGDMPLRRLPSTASGRRCGVGDASIDTHGVRNRDTRDRFAIEPHDGGARLPADMRREWGGYERETESCRAAKRHSQRWITEQTKAHWRHRFERGRVISVGVAAGKRTYVAVAASPRACSSPAVCSPLAAPLRSPQRQRRLHELRRHQPCQRATVRVVHQTRFVHHLQRRLRAGRQRRIRNTERRHALTPLHDQ